DLELNEEKYCDNGDLLYAWSASFGPRIWEGSKAIYHYHIWKVIPKTEIVSKEYLFYLLDWDTEALKAEHATGSTMMHIGKGLIEKRKLPIPSLSVQAEIVRMLDTFKELTVELTVELTARQQQYEYYRDLLLSFPKPEVVAHD
ncbi:restriction endonuclease subunit S, partial [Psychrobacter celer]